MASVLKAIDVELFLLGKLRAAFPGVEFARSARLDPASQDLPPRLITLRRLGGPELNPIVDQAHIDIIVYAPTDLEVNDLALKVQAFLSVINEGAVCKVSVSGPSDLGGPTPRRYMYADVRLARLAFTL